MVEKKKRKVVSMVKTVSTIIFPSESNLILTVKGKPHETITDRG